MWPGRVTDARPPGPILGRRLAAEVCGTFALVFVAAGGDAMARVIGPNAALAVGQPCPGSR